ncbi:MAG: hypothetical protein WBB67_12175 [bacterium]
MLRDHEKKVKTDEFENGKFIAEYNRNMKSARKKNIRYVHSFATINLPVRYYDVNTRSITKCLKHLFKNKKCADYFFTLAYFYFSKARMSADKLFIDFPQPLWSDVRIDLALSHLRRAVALDKDNPYIHCLLAACYLVINDSRCEKWRKKFDEKLYNMNKEEGVLLVAVLFVGVALSKLRDVLISIKIENNYEKAREILELTIEEFKNIKPPHFLPAACYSCLYFIYETKGLHENAISILKEQIRLYHDNPVGYYSLGFEYLEELNYELSSSYFEKAIELLPKGSFIESCIIVMNEFSRGMLKYQERKKWFYKDNLKEIYKHFFKCSELINDKLEKHGYKVLKYLPRLIEIDKRIFDLRESISFIDLKYRVANIIENMEPLMYTIMDSSRLFFIPTPEAAVASPFYVKFAYLQYLNLLLQKNWPNMVMGDDFYQRMKNVFLPATGSHIDEIKKNNILKILGKRYLDIFEAIRQSLKIPTIDLLYLTSALGRVMLNSSNFGEDTVIFDDLEAFKEKMNNRSIDEIGSEEEAVLLKILFQSFEKIANDLFALELMKNISSQFLEGKNEIMVELRETREMIKLELLKKEEEKDLKILTNARVDNTGKVCEIYKEVSYKWIDESEFDKRVENKDEYFIWMNYENGKVFLFGKPFAKGDTEKPCKNSPGFRKLIVFLLKEQEYHSYDKVFKIYTGDEYLYKKEQRKRINKVASKLLKYSKGLLETYIHYDAGRSLGLNTKGMPFCITFKKLY